MSDRINQIQELEQEEKSRNTLVYEDADEYGWILLNKRVIFARNLSSDAIRLYSILKSYAYQKNHAFPGYETLCLDMQVKRDAVRRYMKELETAGLIEQKRRGLGLTNIYILKSIKNARLDVPREHLPESENEADDAKTLHQDDASLRHPNDASLRHKESKVEEEKRKNQKSNLRKADALKTEKEGGESSAGTHSHIPREATGSIRKNARYHQVNPDPSIVTNGTTPARKQIPTQKRATKIEAEKQKLRPIIGRPITQDEIDEKRRNGQNASGLTPFASIIPSSHCPKLETGIEASPIGSNGIHYNSTTRHAPAFIDALIEQFSKLLHDEEANIPRNINRAAKLYRQSEVSEEMFITILHDAYSAARRKQNISIPHSDGRPNKMPYFFSVLEDKLGLKTGQANGKVKDKP